MLVRDALFTAIDFESAGAAPGLTDAPVQCGMASMRGASIDPDSFFRSYLNPGRAVTWQASQVHGISTADLAGAPAMGVLWPAFRSRLAGAVVVAHSAGTEKRFLRTFPMHGFGPWLDTVVLARRAWPNLPDYSLEALITNFGFRAELDALCPGLRFHDALYDAVGALLVLRQLVQTAGLMDGPLRDLLC
ncbi:MAG: exonuclease domain-containing protein [Verrucomicrobiota bacterium]|jgi:DNA polymerase-3 subunit epsilon